jgi:hypothetical protein
VVLRAVTGDDADPVPVLPDLAHGASQDDPLAERGGHRLGDADRPAVLFLHSVPGGGSDITLDLLCLSAGAAMGAIGGLATRLRAGADGRPLGRAGVLAASMWIAGTGARMVFYLAATHGAGPAVCAVPTV